MNHTPSLLVLCIAALAGLFTAPHARAAEKWPAEVINEVVVPVPREIFSALDELGSVNWAVLVKKPDYVVQTDRSATAMVFGIVIAEGFIAVQARDEEATKKLGPKVLELAELLGVKDAVTAHAKAIVDTADQGDWDGVRRELDRTQATVRRTMEELRDAPLAQFVSMGGWLRGTEAASAAITASFAPEKAELLHQPGLVAHFEKVVASLDGKADKLPSFKEIRKGLPQLGEIMKRPEINAEAAGKIRELCGSMVAATLGAGAPPQGGKP